MVGCAATSWFSVAERLLPVAPEWSGWYNTDRTLPDAWPRCLPDFLCITWGALLSLTLWGLDRVTQT